MKPLIRTHSRLVFTNFEKVLQSESADNREKIMEAYENMKAWPWSDSNLYACNDHMKQKDQRNPEERTIRYNWTVIAQEIAAVFGLSGAERFQVFSVRLVDQAAARYHIDQKGFGPTVMVVVLKSNGKYRVDFARVKDGQGLSLFSYPTQ